ncbi:MAG: prepilin-type N-terminal cleavage/methylation domain-containing protein [bacterium]|nr:prepilin-type N-terminal cleavage/methylation domain-containing protein [bacterium]
MLIQSFEKESKTASTKHKSGGGFTLIEVLAAAFLMTMGAGAAFGLIQRTVAFTGNAVLQLQAAYLAQEGVEITRNIRDTNLLNMYKGNGGEWTDSLTGCQSGCEADYTAGSLAVSQDRFLKYGSGLYNYTTGENTLFKRSIVVLEPSPEVLEVAVIVTWEERGREHQIKAATELYNWLPEAP